MPQVTLFEYQDDWPLHFRNAAAEVAESIDLRSSRIEHIGSTSIVGLCAKPVIDILLGVGNLSDLEPQIASLATLGYVYRPEYETELPDRRYFVRPPTAIPRIHLHAVVLGSQLWIRQLVFRDALRADADLAHRYGSLKYELAALHADDKAAYTDAKRPFIERVLAKQQHLGSHSLM